MFRLITIRSLLMLVLFSTLATAQETQGKWEIELRAGWSQAIRSMDGTGFLPDPGALFLTFSGEP